MKSTLLVIMLGILYTIASQLGTTLSPGSAAFILNTFLQGHAGASETAARDACWPTNACPKQDTPGAQYVITTTRPEQWLITPATASISPPPRTKPTKPAKADPAPAPAPAPGPTQAQTPAPARARVEAPAQQVLPKELTIDQDFLRQILKSYLNDDKKRLPGAETRITYINTPATFTLPGENLSWEVFPFERGDGNDSNFTITFKVKELPIKRCVIKTELQTLAAVASAAVTLEKGRAIKPGDIRLIKRALTKDCNPFTETQTLIGMLPNKTIPQGRIIEDRDVTPPAVIKKGELVKILAVKGNLRLFVTGVAVTDGLIGEVIKVENIDSKKLIPCRVASPGIVIAEF